MKLMFFFYRDMFDPYLNHFTRSTHICTYLNHFTRQINAKCTILSVIPLILRILVIHWQWDSEKLADLMAMTSVFH